MNWLVAIAGGCGALARAVVDDLITRRGPAWAATLTINILGSLLIGISATALSTPWQTIISTGFCGGFTTFSTACWQAARSLAQRDARWAVGYAILTATTCVAAAWAGTLMGAAL